MPCRTEELWETVVRRLHEDEEEAAARHEHHMNAALELAEALIAYHNANLTPDDWTNFNQASTRYHGALAAYRRARVA